jgi:hypothetical protein
MSREANAAATNVGGGIKVYVLTKADVAPQVTANGTRKVLAGRRVELSLIP